MSVWMMICSAGLSLIVILFPPAFFLLLLASVTLAVCGVQCWTIVNCHLVPRVFVLLLIVISI
eukprot:m.36628 g.36628  ORF g.36628 m.36628 type:complete len:63 (-) comp44750_c0_seq2:12-200(-)